MAKALVIKSADFSENRLAQVTLGNVDYCTGITLNRTKITSTKVDVTETLVATVTPANCAEAIIWMSSDEAVATVKKGVVTLLGLGTATVTVTCGSHSATCEVVVDNVVVDTGATFAYISNTDGNDYARFVAPYYDKLTYADRVPTDTGRLRLTYDSLSTDYLIAPLVMPSGVSQVTVKASGVKAWYSCYIFFFASKVVSSLPKLAKMVEKIGHDASNNTVDYTVDVPEGADSIVVMVDMLTTYTDADDADAKAKEAGFELVYKTV